MVINIWWKNSPYVTELMIGPKSLLMKHEYFTFLTVKKAEIHFYCKISHFLPNIIMKSESFAGFLESWVQAIWSNARERGTRG